MYMRYVVVIALVAAPFFLLAQENIEKPDTLLIHPGETLYATFQRTGDSLTLAHVSKDADKEAQLTVR